MSKDSQKYVCVFGAISTQSGLICTLYKDQKAFDAADVREFLQEIAERLKHTGRRVVIFADNASIHRAVELRPDFLELDQMLLLNVAYRPDFMGLEKYWRLLKHLFYTEVDRWRLLAKPDWTTRDGIHEAIDIVERRKSEKYPRFAERCAQSGWTGLAVGVPVTE